ncbi:MAG: lactoylglutathione lyase [Myxococcota bacterium]|jgi:lactoylglutathione lyase
MIRVLDPKVSLHFYCDLLGLTEVRRYDSEQGKFTLIYLQTGTDGDNAQVELTHNWDEAELYTNGRNFGHMAFAVDDIYAVCTKMQDDGVTILRPPRDGRMAFIKCPDGISIELLQSGAALPLVEPWKSMPSTGSW